MNTIRFTLILLITSAVIITAMKHNKASFNKIIEQSTDERGLTSIIYVTPQNDTVGLDYLTSHEIDSVINH